MIMSAVLLVLTCAVGLCLAAVDARRVYRLRRDLRRCTSSELRWRERQDALARIHRRTST